MREHISGKDATNIAIESDKRGPVQLQPWPADGEPNNVDMIPASTTPESAERGPSRTPTDIATQSPSARPEAIAPKRSVPGCYP